MKLSASEETLRPKGRQTTSVRLQVHYVHGPWRNRFGCSRKRGITSGPCGRGHLALGPSDYSEKGPRPSDRGHRGPWYHQGHFLGLGSWAWRHLLAETLRRKMVCPMAVNHSRPAARSLGAGGSDCSQMSRHAACPRSRRKFQQWYLQRKQVPVRRDFRLAGGSYVPFCSGSESRFLPMLLQGFARYLIACYILLSTVVWAFQAQLA